MLFTLLNVHRDPTFFYGVVQRSGPNLTFHPPKSGFRDQIYQSRLDGGWYLYVFVTSDDDLTKVTRKQKEPESNQQLFGSYPSVLGEEHPSRQGHDTVEMWIG